MEDKTMIVMVVAIMGVLVLAQVLQACLPAPPSYCCPICNMCFNTYDELYTHFTTEHPSEPIDIIWSD